MWFLKNRPRKLSFHTHVKSIEKGYQHTSIQFTLDSALKLLVAVPFPYAPHKPNGSFKLATSLIGDQSAIPIEESQITIYTRGRDLKNVEGVEMFNVQELLNWHVEDFGFATFWVEPDKTYDISFTHKIAPDSCLFVSTRLPTLVVSGNPQIEFKLTVEGANIVDIQEGLTILNSRKDPVVKAEYTAKTWGDDIRFHTFNWDSSDDESEDSE